MKQTNPTLEEFSLQRFNQLRKMIVKYYERISEVYQEYGWTKEGEDDIANRQRDDHLAFMEKSVNQLVEFFKSDKVRLEFVLDYLIVHFYSRVLKGLLDPATKYRPETKKFNDQYDELTFDNAFAFLKAEKHWANAFLKPLFDVIKKRKIVDPKALSYFETKENYRKNIEEGAQHFFGMFPLPEFRELKKIKWDTAEFTIIGGIISIFKQMEEMEAEINEKLKDKSILPSKEVEVGGEDFHNDPSLSKKGRLLRKGKTLIEFQDKSKWVDLQVPACGMEGASLEHCGNTYRQSETNLRVWSFRTPTDEPGFYVGRLTFIYNTSNKMIGEAKGRNNQKPQSKFHPYIVELLLLDIVDGLEQGRHATHNDFAFSDLSDDLLMRLINEKPTLFSKSRVGRSVIISRKLGEVWKEAYKKVTGQEAPDLETLKFDRD